MKGQAAAAIVNEKVLHFSDHKLVCDLGQAINKFLKDNEERIERMLEREARKHRKAALLA